MSRALVDSAPRRSTHDGLLRVLIVEHERNAPAGLIRCWLDEQNALVDEHRIDIDDRQVDPRTYQLIVSLGSELAAYDDELAVVRREKRLLQQAIEASVPVLGICFGGQLLARVLGGHGFRATNAEIGWMSVRTGRPDLVGTGPWFQWHFDSFTVPPGAELIAESGVGPQAFIHERSLGLQFHPEVTPEIVAGWVKGSRDELDRERVDTDALLRETDARVEATRRMTWRLLGRYVDTVVCAGAEGVRNH